MSQWIEIMEQAEIQVSLGGRSQAGLVERPDNGGEHTVRDQLLADVVP